MIIVQNPIHNIHQDQMLLIVLIRVVVHLCFNYDIYLNIRNNSETDAILNALKSTPSVQPIRSVKGVGKQSVKRSAQSNLSSSRFDKRAASPISSSPQTAYMSGISSSSMNSGVSQGQPMIQMSLQGVSSSRPSVSDWQVLVNQSGVEYYFNQRTRAVTYQKPDELKSEAERALKVLFLVYIYFRHAHGRSHTRPTDIPSGQISSHKSPYGKSLRNISYIKKNFLAFRALYRPVQPLPLHLLK